MTTFGAALRKKYMEIGQYEPVRLKYLDGGWEAVREAMLEPHNFLGPTGTDLFHVLIEKMVMDDGGWEAFCREMFPGCLPPDPNPDYNISGPVPPGEALLAECRRLRGEGEEAFVDAVLTLHMPPETKKDEDLQLVTLKSRTPSTRAEPPHNFETLYGARPFIPPDRDPTT